MQEPVETVKYTQRRALVSITALTLAHVTVLAGVFRKYQIEFLALPEGFRFSDLLEGIVTLLLAQAYDFLFSCTESSLLSSQLHELFKIVMVLAQGGHIMVNPLDDWYTSLQVPAEQYRTLYWQHEYFCHRLFAFGVFGMLTVSASCSGAPSSLSLDWTVLAMAVLQGIVVGFLGIGTRTVLATLPFCIIILFNWMHRKNAGLIALHAAIVAITMITIHVVWFVKNEGSLPTFDDLASASSSSQMIDQSSQIAKEFLSSTMLAVWSAPVTLSVVTMLMWTLIWRLLRWPNVTTTIKTD